MNKKRIEEETIMSSNFMTGFGPAEGGGFNMPLEAAQRIKKKKGKKIKSFKDYFIVLQKRKNNEKF